MPNRIGILVAQKTPGFAPQTEHRQPPEACSTHPDHSSNRLTGIDAPERTPVPPNIDLATGDLEKFGMRRPSIAEFTPNPCNPQQLCTIKAAANPTVPQFSWRLP
jgi:hypothetical protein